MNSRTIRDNRVQRIHAAFSNIRYIFSTFYEVNDDTLIRFSFSESEDDYIFKIKFTNSHKFLKFYVSKRLSNNTIQYTKQEKTTNIIQNIDQLYQVKERKSFDFNSLDFDSLMYQLFFWGVIMTERHDELYKAKAVRLTKENCNNIKDPNCIYYDVVVAYTLEADPNTPSTLIANLALLNEGSVKLVLPASNKYLIATDKILFINSEGRFNLLSFKSSKHHVTFKQAEYHKLVNYFNMLPIAM